MKYRILIMAMAVLYLVSCHSGEMPPLSPDTGKIMVKQNNTGLFADLDGYDWNASETRSDTQEDDDAMVSLEELLDRSGKVSRTFRGLTLDQIPFLDSGKEFNVSLSSNNFARQGYFPDNMTITGAKKFYLKSSDESVWPSRVVTMVPDSAFLANFSMESISYFDKALFSGIILFSDPDGSFRDVYVYDGDAPVAGGLMEKPGCSYETDEDTRSLYLSCTDDSETATRRAGTVRSYKLHYSICIAYVTEKPVGPELPDNFFVDRINQEITEETETSGGGGGGQTDGREMTEDFFTCTLTLYTTQGGCTVGSGRYPYGRDVTVKASPYMVGYEFDRWTGDLNGRASTASFNIKSDVESTAYFKSLADTSAMRRPCWSAYSGKANPLKEMSLAASGTGGWNLKGATYGNTRVGVVVNEDGSRSITSKWHGGLDLMADVGTPVYAMYDGELASSYVVTQPDRNDSGRYPSTYSGDMNDAGNRIYIDSEIDGNKVRMGYCHLQAGNPVAKNPRTGEAFAPGDKVFRGEIVAYTGQTGNAFNVENKHLHLSVQENGKAVNPEKYINGKVVKQTYLPGEATVMSAELAEIRCDDEPQEDENRIETGYLFK